MSSLIGEYYITTKPICLLYSDFGRNVYPKEYLDSLFVAKDAQDINQFIATIIAGIDEKKDIRNNLCEINFRVSNISEPVSKRILENIYEELKIESEFVG